MGISIALNLLPLIKNLSKQEQHLEKFFTTYTKLAKLAKNPEAAEKQIQQAWKVYSQQVSEVEKEIQKAAEVLFYRIISRTRRHTNRAAGSWAMSWNTKSDDGDLGFADPNFTNEITFYSGKKDWYPEAPVTESGVKVLGVHDWGEIILRHRNMVNNVIQNFTFKREWGQRNSKGQMMSHNTIFIYNECPYIEAMENGAFDESPSGNMVALSIAEMEAKLHH